MRSASPSETSSGPGTPPDEAMVQAKPGVEQVHVDRARWDEPYTFQTLAMQQRFMRPSTQQLDVPALHELTAPHVESFNALWA